MRKNLLALLLIPSLLCSCSANKDNGYEYVVHATENITMNVGDTIDYNISGGNGPILISYIVFVDDNSIIKLIQNPNNGSRYRFEAINQGSTNINFLVRYNSDQFIPSYTITVTVV